MQLSSHYLHEILTQSLQLTDAKSLFYFCVLGVSTGRPQNVKPFNK